MKNITFEMNVGNSGAAGAGEIVPEKEVAPGARLTEVVGPMQAIFATYTTAELQRIDAVCATKGIEINQFDFVTQEGANLIKAELDKVAVTPVGEKIVSKAAADQVAKLLWQHAE